MKETPMLSLKERDRRWALVRRMMKEKGLDCLIVAGLQDRSQLDCYLSYEPGQGVVILPLQGEPTYLTWHGSKVGRHVENYTHRGITPWIEDWRVGGWGGDWVSVIKEKGFESAAIGVAGLAFRGAFTRDGFIPYKTWSYVLEHLPGATFVEVSSPFSEIMQLHSEEELTMMRYSAMIGERVCQAMLDITKPGVSENEIYAVIAETTYRHGGRFIMPNMRIGPTNVGAGPPVWIYQGQKRPYLVKKGDVLGSEIFVSYGGLETQQQMTIALEPVSDIAKKCAEVANSSYKAGLKMCYPGRTFKEVADAMEAAVVDAGCWHMGPLLHTMPIGAGVSALDVGVSAWAKCHNLKGEWKDQTGVISEMVLEPGMSLQLEPNACLDDLRINVGCNVIITKGEPEELNKLPVEMRIVS